MIENKKSQEPRDLIFIISPFDALSIYSALEFVEEKQKISKSLKDSIKTYKRQLNRVISDEQIDDALAEFAVRNLLGKY